MTSARIDIVCCELSQIGDAQLARYKNLLSAEESARLRNFRSQASAREFLVSRALLRTELAQRAQCAPDALSFTHNEDGKPSLSCPPSNWQFNLTHSHGWIALALCEGGSIGIDIESYDRRNNLPAIAQRFFSAEENQLLSGRSEDEWLDYFFAIWTLKEAHAKALGCGLSKILSCSSVDVDLTTGKIDLNLSDIAATSERISSWLYKLDERCVLAAIAHGDVDCEPHIFHCVPLQSRNTLSPTIWARG
ncbi:MAG TPA: 4'-phosphopantetheinyl transferase superfamily protein [Spongiibacteraceae bacterium]|nr:4'-phosphopantetheinyl transferase superfamily protein [Spongiibacteraceae bacterium]